VRTTLVGLLVLMVATCSGWCTRLHAHDEGLHHHDGPAATAPAPDDAEGPRPVNDDNCACAGALPGFAAMPAAALALSPLPFDHPFAMAAGPLDEALVGASGTPSAADPRPAGDPGGAALRASRLRC
jgi:hypothetical protein